MVIKIGIFWKITYPAPNSLVGYRPIKKISLTRSRKDNVNQYLNRRALAGAVGS
jgi:hypothetical protein